MSENKAGIYPTHDKVLLEPYEIEEISPGGIVLAAQVKDKEMLANVHGFVVAMGETAREMHELRGIKIGDLVIHAKFAGILYGGKDGKKYRLCRASDVIAKSEGVYDKSLKGPVPMPGVA
jgi:co-chaperonin GroES (HSP10)